MAPVFLVEPAGGLSNRMRTLISARMLAADLNVPLLVLWKLDQHLNCRFDELFERPKFIKGIIHIAADYRYKIFDALVPRLFSRKLEQLDVEAMNKRGADYIDFAKGASLFVRTHSRFHRECDYDMLTPLPSYLNRVAAYKLEGRNTVGVHIRRTDHNVAIANSPTELFVDAMQRELEQQPDTVFFLATDSPEEEQALRRRFPDRIISHPKTSLDRKQPAAIKDALVDLYCLSRCRKLIGSYWSSFTDTAAAMNGIEVEVVKKVS